MPALISSTGASRSVEDEGAAGCCDVELVADAEPGVQIAAGGAVVFALDGDPVVAGIGRAREGVVPEHRPLLLVGLDPKREVLAGPRRRKRCAVGVVEAYRDHGVALARDSGDGQSAETGPCRGRAGCRQAGVAAAGFPFEQGTERRLPARAEGRNPERAKQLLARMPGEVEERVRPRRRSSVPGRRRA